MTTATATPSTEETLDTTVDTAATTATPEPEMSERERVMNQIASVNEERIDAEHVAEGLAPVVAAPKPDTPAATPAPVADQLTTQMEEGLTIVTPEQLAKMAVRTKVDGIEQVVTLDKPVRDYQIQGAADHRLEEAKRLLKETRELAARPPAGNDDAHAPAQSPTSSAPAATPAPVSEGKRKLVKALFEGDEDGALQALDEVIGAGRQEPIQIEQLASQVAPVIRQQMSEADALREFGKSFTDISTDPFLASLADTFVDAEMKEGKPFSEALMNAGGQVRDWMKSKGMTTAATPAATPAPQASIDRTQKLAAKDGIDNLPALNRAAATSEAPVESHSDVIAQMAKSRGLA